MVVDDPVDEGVGVVDAVGVGVGEGFGAYVASSSRAPCRANRRELMPSTDRTPSPGCASPRRASSVHSVLSP